MLRRSRVAGFAALYVAEQEPGPCSFHAGLPARIVGMSAQGSVWVAHGDERTQSPNIKLPCWLNPGDTVNVDRDGSASVKLWSGQSVSVTSSNNPYEIAAPQEPSW